MPATPGATGANADRANAAARDSTAPNADLDAFLIGLDYPVFIVTVQHHGEKGGCLVGFATQTSLDPQRLLVCLSVANHTYDIARIADLLAVHVLRAEQHDLAARFATTTGDETDKFAQCRWQPGPGGVPLLADCAARMVGKILDHVPLGDHVGFLLAPLRVERIAAAPSPPLTFQQVKHLRAAHPA